MPNLIGKVVVRGWDAVKRQWKSGMPHFGRWWGTTHGAAPPTGRNMNWALGAGGLAVVALAAAGVIVATGGDGAGETQGDPSARSCRTTTLLAGAKDGYSSAVDTPSASLSQGLQTRLSGSPLVGFDSGAIDRRFAHTFAGLPQGIVAASVTLRLKPIQSSISPGSRNDTLDLSFTDAAGTLQPGGWSRFLGSGNSTAGLRPNSWYSGNYNSGHQFGPLDLANLPAASGPSLNLLPQLNALLFLDVIVQDDSSVDWVSLDVCVASPTPTPVLITALPATAVGRATSTPTPLSVATASLTFTPPTQTPPSPVPPTAVPVPTDTPVPAPSATPAPSLTPTPRLTATPTPTCAPAGTAGACTPTPTIGPPPTNTPSPSATACGGTPSTC